MHLARVQSFVVRRARPEEFSRLGHLVADAYASLPGMPSAEEQPEYYAMLRDVGTRASNPSISIFAAVDDSGELLGSVDFIDDMKQYGSGSSARNIPDAAGIRLLVVKAECRGLGIGKVLTRFCIEQARVLGRSKVVLHTTRAMNTAWSMYEKIGFERLPGADFRQGNLEVFGFQLALRPEVHVDVDDAIGREMR
jgi:ribosomal protein S18 acetylase RimI-like enzyme